jgi:hypothetical protein
VRCDDPAPAEALEPLLGEALEPLDAEADVPSLPRGPAPDWSAKAAKGVARHRASDTLPVVTRRRVIRADIRASGADRHGADVVTGCVSRTTERETDK